MTLQKQLVLYKYVPGKKEGAKLQSTIIMRQIFWNPESKAVLLVDVTNAFNSLNRKAALHNISISCPPLAQILISTYRATIRMIIPGSSEIASTEGTTLLCSAYAGRKITSLNGTMHGDKSI